MDGAGTNISVLMTEIGKAARAAARELGQVSTERKNKALTAAAAALRAHAAEIKAANAPASCRPGADPVIGRARDGRAGQQRED